MPSTICGVVHSSRIGRDGLASILAKSPFEPACTASSAEDAPSPIADAGEPVLVLIDVREGSGLVDDMVAVKPSFPDAHEVVLGDPCKLRALATFERCKNPAASRAA